MEPFTPKNIASLVHWLDFSSSETYGNADLSKLENFADVMGNMVDITVNGNVGYKVNANGDLNAIYVNASKTSLSFKTSKAGKNPEVSWHINWFLNRHRTKNFVPQRHSEQRWVRLRIV